MAIITVIGCSPRPRHIAAPTPPRSPPHASSAGGSTERCSLVTGTAPIARFVGHLPDGVTERDAYAAILQALATSSIPVERRSSAAHAIVTERFDGQTLRSTCAVNHHRLYALRIAVAGRKVSVAMDCLEAVGRDGIVVGGVYMPPQRGAFATCTEPMAASQLDAGLPLQIFRGAMEMIALRGRRSKPDPSAPPWWCHGGRSACFRGRNACTASRSTGDAACEPRRVAYCTRTAPLACFGDVELCELDHGKHRARACEAVR